MMVFHVHIDGGLQKIKDRSARQQVQTYMASEVKRLSDPYVPMQSGHLKGSAQISGDGSTLIYPGPYAHYQHEGRVMGPNILTSRGWRSGKAPKHYTGGVLSYHGAPKRGPHWERRMLADKGPELKRGIVGFIKSGGY